MPPCGDFCDPFGGRGVDNFLRIKTEKINKLIKKTSKRKYSFHESKQWMTMKNIDKL